MQQQESFYKTLTRDSYQNTAKEFCRNVAGLAPLSSIDKFCSLLPQKASIVDLGCGSGRDAHIFSKWGASVVGVDFCPELLAMAKLEAPMAKFQLMDMEELSFPEQSFDGAWAAASLLHIPKSKILSVLQNIHAILKDNGHFYLTVKKGCGEVLEEDQRYEGAHKKFWSYFEEDELKELLNKARFNILEFAHVDKTHPYQTHACIRVFCQKRSLRRQKDLA